MLTLAFVYILYVYLYIYICVCVYICNYICVCMYAHKHINKHKHMFYAYVIEMIEECTLMYTCMPPGGNASFHWGVRHFLGYLRMFLVFWCCLIYLFFLG